MLAHSAGARLHHIECMWCEEFSVCGVVTDEGAEIHSLRRGR